MTQRPQTTREVLAAAVKEEYGFDISPLWHWMTTAELLPKELPVNWDPVWGRHGAYEHFRGRRSVRHGSPPKHGAFRESLAGEVLRDQCKLCGVARVVLMCYHETISQIRVPQHQLRFRKLLQRLEKQLRNTKASLEKGVVDYEAANRAFLATEFAKAREQQRQAPLDLTGLTEEKARSARSKREEAILKLDAMAKDPGKHAVLSTYRELNTVEWFDDLEKVLLHLEDEVRSGMGIPFQDRISPTRAGRPPKMIARARAILKDEGFSWREVADLVREELDVVDSEGAFDRARDQVRRSRVRL